MAPTLLERAALRQQQARSAASSTSNNSNMPPSSPPRDTSLPPSDFNQLSDSDFPSPSALSASQRAVPNMTAFGDRQLKRVKLTDEECKSDYRRHCETTNPHERENLMYLALMEFKQESKEIKKLLVESKAEEFKTNGDIKAEIRNYSRAFLLDPTLEFYSSNSNLKILIIECMRKEKVAGIPAKSAPRKALQELESDIGHQISVDRHYLKDLLVATMKSGTECTDLATVAAGLLATWAVPAPLTAQLLWRLAFIRTQLAQQSTRSDFWDKVDKELQSFRNHGPGVLVFGLEESFKDDLAKYGQLSTEIPLEADISSASPSWLQRVRKLAPKVQNVKVTNPALPNPRKRRAPTQATPDSDQEEADQPIGPAQLDT